MKTDEQIGSDFRYGFLGAAAAIAVYCFGWFMGFYCQRQTERIDRPQIHYESRPPMPSKGPR